MYGVGALLLLLWALRPNIRALMEGRERFHGWRPWRKKTAEADHAPDASGDGNRKAL
jgi:hypothetical protein